MHDTWANLAQRTTKQANPSAAPSKAGRANNSFPELGLSSEIHRKILPGKCPVLMA